MLGAKHGEKTLALYRVWREADHDDWWLLIDESENSAIEMIALMYDVPANGLRAAPDREAKHRVPSGVVLDRHGQTKTKGKK
jgi:hypothetical protein